LASYAEQEVLCAPGGLTIKGSVNTQPVVQAGIDLYLATCTDSLITFDAESVEPDLVITDTSVAEPEMCASSVLTTSIMNQFSALVYFSDELGGIILSPQATAGILNGQITFWNDPLIVETNPGFELPQLLITLIAPEKLHQSDQAFINWMKTITGQEINFKPQKTVPDLETLVTELTEVPGSVSIVPSNVIYDNSLTFANMLINDIEFVFDSTSFSNASSQVFMKEETNLLTGSLDPEVPPVADANETGIQTSWQGISYYQLGLCKTDETNAARTFMRFLARLDAQGQLESYGYFPLTEPLRVKVAAKIGETLPTPTIDPALLNLE
jgi:hypothetical protein